jgi:hypothetical protein
MPTTSRRCCRAATSAAMAVPAMTPRAANVCACRVTRGRRRRSRGNPAPSGCMGEGRGNRGAALNQNPLLLTRGAPAHFGRGGVSAMTRKRPAGFRDRIKAFRRVPARELLKNPRNWRTHPKAQQEALRGILSEIGYADALLARETEDGGLILVDGHLRAETTPDQEVPVLVLDVTEAEADKLLLSIDPLAELAETNAQALDGLLRDVQTGSEGLAGMWEALARENGLLPEDKAEVTEFELKPPPQMAWVLISVPVVRYGDVQKALEHIAGVPEVTLLTTANDTRAQDG